MAYVLGFLCHSSRPKGESDYVAWHAQHSDGFFLSIKFFSCVWLLEVILVLSGT